MIKFSDLDAKIQEESIIVYAVIDGSAKIHSKLAISIDGRVVKRRNPETMKIRSEMRSQRLLHWFETFEEAQNYLVRRLKALRDMDRQRLEDSENVLKHIEALTASSKELTEYGWY